MGQTKEVTGRVVECLTNAQFFVKLDDSETVIRCYLAGKMRLNKIRVIMGDAVKVQIPDNISVKNTVGRIVFRKI